MNNKKTISILTIFGIILAAVGGTLAYWTWSTAEEQQTNVVFTVNKDFSCAADGGGNITESDVTLAPTTCTDTARAIKREVKVTPTLNRDGLTIYMDLWLDVNVMGSGLSASNNFKYVLTTSSTSCTDGTIISSGSFNGKTAGSRVRLFRQRAYTQTLTDTYYLYIWLDAAEEDSATMNQAFSLSLNGSCSDEKGIYLEDNLNGADPVLDEGMIPVTIANDGTVTTADLYSEWYSYEDKKWANAVLVTNGSRTNYVGTTNKTVSESDILGYYVWIPRFKYQVWTTTTSSKGNEQEIQVMFEDANASMSAGTSIGSYRTHPAFWWDHNNSGSVDAGEMVSGIWVGKFETTGDETTPTIKPNLSSLYGQNVRYQFETSRKFSTDASYGLTTTNAHMMKNSEWGAVAYLSHSVYGINQEIYINNSSNKITGRSGGAVGGSQKKVSEQFSGESSTRQYNKYGYYTWLGQSVDASGNIGSYANDTTLGTYASTTGNVTGVYDMSGGSYEYVMGNFGDTIDGSSFTVMPDKKYYDLYSSSQFTGTSGTNASLCTLDTCGGHALYETNGWYGDDAYFVYSGDPWFARGGSYYDGAGAGAFRSTIDSGSWFNHSPSWRSVLVVGFGA